VIAIQRPVSRKKPATAARMGRYVFMANLWFIVPVATVPVGGLVRWY